VSVIGYISVWIEPFAYPTEDNAMKKLFKCLLMTATLVTANAGFAQADKYPSKPIQVVITSTPGSTSDVITRFLGQEVSRVLGQPIVVVAKPSENSVIGADFARRAAPDGYTLFLGGNTAMAANVHLVKNLSYDPIRDFDPITLVSINPLVLVVRSNLPINSVPELVSYAKARPGQMNYGVGNAGGKVAVNLLRSMTGIDALEVPFKGASQAVQELIAGRLDFMAVDPLVVAPFIKQGTLRALAITSAVRLPTMNSVPTMAEAGVPGYDYASFLGYFVPKGTPKPIIDALNGAFTKAVTNKEGQEFYDKMAMIAKTTTPEGLTAFNKDQIANWGRLVKIAGLQAE
jgi:tripartite-type tricarboxylate transporter receptor subunit TctC